jgi:hypothetical protein
MTILVGAKTWTSGNQCGIRIYKPAIVTLGPAIPFQDRFQIYPTMADFLALVVANAGAVPRPHRYSRRLLVVSQGQSMLTGRCATFSDHTGSLQGYVTALPNTWFHNYVQSVMDTDFNVQYIATPDRDLLILP